MLPDQFVISEVIILFPKNRAVGSSYSDGYNPNAAFWALKVEVISEGDKAPL